MACWSVAGKQINPIFMFSLFLRVFFTMKSFVLALLVFLYVSGRRSLAGFLLVKNIIRMTADSCKYFVTIDLNKLV